MSGTAEGAHAAHDPTVALVRMANQIGTFFESQREDVRLSGIVDHIGSSWTKKMRADIYAHVAAGGAGLLPIVIEALKILQSNDQARAAARG